MVRINICVDSGDLRGLGFGARSGRVAIKMIAASFIIRSLRVWRGRKDEGINERNGDDSQPSAMYTSRQVVAC